MGWIMKKANSMIGFLKRNQKMANKCSKISGYLAIVKHYLEYWCMVWNPHT